MENLVKPACLLRYDELKGVKAKVAPILWQYGVFARLNAEDYVTDALDKIGYSISIGYNGIYETTKIMTGKSHTTKEGFEFAEQVVKFLNDKAEKWKAETGKGFSVYQTPQEESTDWFCNKLKAKFGIVKDVTDNYTGGSVFESCLKKYEESAKSGKDYIEMVNSLEKAGLKESAIAKVVSTFDSRKLNECVRVYDTKYGKYVNALKESVAADNFIEETGEAKRFSKRFFN